MAMERTGGGCCNGRVGLQSCRCLRMGVQRPGAVWSRVEESRSAGEETAPLERAALGRGSGRSEFR